MDANHKLKSLMKFLQTFSLYALPAYLLYTLWVPAGYQFSATEYKPVKSIVCPGESLVFTSEIKTKANTVVHRYRTIVDIESDVNVIPDKNGDVIIWKNTSEGKREVVYPVPQLKPGAYALRVAFESRNHRPIMYEVPFTIPLTCKS